MRSNLSNLRLIIFGLTPRAFLINLNKKFIVTEELKRESIDLVRCIANNSSGKKDNDY